jgi:hypothetical protein
MNDVRTEILSSVNEIDEIVIESMIDVYSSISVEYDKMCVISEQYNGDDISAFGIIQEGDIWDQATGKYSNDNTFMKIIKFIPRLLIAIMDSIVKTFKKDYKTTIEKNGDTTIDVINNANSDELTRLVTTTQQSTNGMMSFDKEKKTFTLGKKLSSAWNRIKLLSGIAASLGRLRQEIKSPNTPYKKFADELKNIFKGNKEMDEVTISVGAEALKSALMDSTLSCGTIHAACKELSRILENKCIKDSNQGKDTQKAQEIKELIDQIGEVSKTVGRVSLLGRIGNALFSDIALTKKGKATAKSGIEKLGNKLLGGAIHSEEQDEIDDINFQNQNLSAQIRGNETAADNVESLHEEKEKANRLHRFLNNRKNVSERKRKNAEIKRGSIS